ncbi:oxidoreductase-like protein [Mycena galericulata]|nr:oxidoreductase-like protein [Mycena galericulata]
MLALRALCSRFYLSSSSSSSPFFRPRPRHSHSSRYPTLDADTRTSLDAGTIERLRNPTRGGQNLSLRYRRLEQSLRGKEALQRDMRARESESKYQEAPDFAEESGVAATKDANYFHGFKIPTRPKAPESDECCMSGCAVCVYDLYEEDLGVYTASLEGLRAALNAKGIPEPGWPEGVRRREDQGGGSKGATLSAFEALERALAEKRMGAVAAGEAKAE